MAEYIKGEKFLDIAVNDCMKYHFFIDLLILYIYIESCGKISRSKYGAEKIAPHHFNNRNKRLKFWHSYTIYWGINLLEND